MFARKSKQDEVVDQAATASHSAIDTAADFLEDALDRIAPFVSAAADKASDLAAQVQPLAEHARDTAQQNLSQAGERIAPLASQVASQAKDQLAPYASTVRERGSDLADQARETLAPRVQTLAGAAQPVVETARTRVQEDLVPRLNDLLQQVANDHPAVADYSNRGQTALQALRGETTKYVPVEVDDPSSSKLKQVAKVAAAGALLAAVLVALRQFLGQKDDGWTAHQPSSGYTPTPAAKPADTKPADTTPSTTVTSEDAAAPLVATSVPEAEEVMTDEGGPVAEVARDEDAVVTPVEPVKVETTKVEAEPATTESDANDADEADTAAAKPEPQYGEGWYMGDNPPADYLIKGNERSMKYHVPGAGGYDRTIADVWFANEEAAQQAGFTRAQR